MAELLPDIFQIKGLYIIPYKSLKVCYLEIGEIGRSGTLQEKGLVSMNRGRVVVEDSFLRFCENLLNSSNAFPILQVVSMFAQCQFESRNAVKDFSSPDIT